MQHEEAQRARHAAQTFLARLHASTKENAVRTERLWRVLWHCYFDPTEPSQLAIAGMVGVSDSSVGDYRRKLESEMRRLSLSFAQVAHFSEALRAELRKRLFGARAGKEAQRRPMRSEVEARAMSPLFVVSAGGPSRVDYAAAT